jgi:hypothetical protein
MYCVESVCITCGSEQDTLYKIIYTMHIYAYDVKQCVWFLIVYLRYFMYKSKEYNGMDILDSIFSDERQKDVMN